MKQLILIAILALAGCGYSSTNNEMTGQIKKVGNLTPIFCFDRVDVDMSLGVMRNGVGSMSSEDVFATVPEKSVQETLKRASESGQLVKVKYNQHRFTWCQENREITSAEILP